MLIDSEHKVRQSWRDELWRKVGLRRAAHEPGGTVSHSLLSRFMLYRKLSKHVNSLYVNSQRLALASQSTERCSPLEAKCQPHKWHTYHIFRPFIKPQQSFQRYIFLPLRGTRNKYYPQPAITSFLQQAAPNSVQATGAQTSGAAFRHHMFFFLNFQHGNDCTQEL